MDGRLSHHNKPVDSGCGGIERDMDIIDEGDVVIAGHDINFPICILLLLDQMIRRFVSGMSRPVLQYVSNPLKGHTDPVYSVSYSLDISG